MRDRILLTVIIIVTIIISFLMFGGTESPDFQATWLAGEFYQAGRFDEIYPHDTDFFTSKPSPAWIEHVKAQGQTTAIYSFIYPPIWAALSAMLTRVTDYQTVLSIAQFLNPIFMMGMVYLAWRTARTSMSAPLYMVITLVILFTTTIGTIALYQDQLQIFISFLIILGIERSRSNAPIAAGAAMALAASFKLYPVLFAIFWLIRGERKAAASFVIFGGALGGLSILLTGWPLHAEFLHAIKTISGGLYINGMNYAFEPALAPIFQPADLTFISSVVNDLNADQGGGIYAMAKPKLWCSSRPSYP